MTEPVDLCYPVITPFKFAGVTIKPPAFVQMSRDEATQYIAAGVIGGEADAALVPDSDAERVATEQAKTTSEPGGGVKEDEAKTPAAGSSAAGGRGGRKATK